MESNGRAGQRDDAGAGQRDADPADTQDATGELPAQAQVVAADPLFDEAFYGRALGISGSRLDLVTHYLTTGEAALLSPSRRSPGGRGGAAGAGADGRRG